VRFIAWLIEDKEAKILSLGKQGISALGTANLILIKTWKDLF
jgi:hypothetical protein